MGALLSSVLVWFLGSSLARILTGAGLAIGSYHVLSAALSTALTWVSSSLGGLAADMTAIIFLAGIGDALSVVGAALTAVAAINSARVFVGMQS